MAYPERTEPPRLLDSVSAEDTIFALASGIGRAAVAVLRLSGPATDGALTRLCGGLPTPRRASLRTLRSPEGEVLDRALVLWMPGPGSYTGEDSAELHLHAGTAVVAGVADALAALGTRPAEAGEFTRRAFLNGRMDLLEAEAIADLVAAETAAQRRQALLQMAGELGASFEGWAGRLRGLLAYQEALIDFPDDDLPPEIEAGLLREMANLATEMRAHLADGRRGERLRDGLLFVVTGAPNVGKSTLVNALSARSVAIVSPLPGTTRDSIETRIDLAGVPVTLVDTAGLRDTHDEIEAEGVRRTRQRAAEADMILAVAEAGHPESEQPAGDHVIRIASKADRGGAAPPGALLVSVHTGQGMDLLRDRLAHEARALTLTQGPPPLTRARHRAALAAAVERLEAAEATAWPELRGENLRIALREIGRVTGRVGVEDILDTIFGQFCIGK